MPRRSSRGRGKARAATRVDVTPPPESLGVQLPAASPTINTLPHPDDDVMAPAIAPSPTLSEAMSAVVAQSQRQAAIDAVAGSASFDARQPVQ